MTNQSSTSFKIFIASITLPVKLIMARSAVASATQVSDVLSFSDIEKLNMAKVYSRFSFTKVVYLFLKSDRSLLKYFLAKKKKMVFGVSFRKKIVEYVKEDIEYVERLTDRQLDGWKII